MSAPEVAEGTSMTTNDIMAARKMVQSDSVYPTNAALANGIMLYRAPNLHRLYQAGWEAGFIVNGVRP